MAPHALTELQLRILRILWDRGEASVQEVREALGEYGREPATSTVATLLGRLEERGILTHRTEGVKYLYRPAVAESEVRRSVVSEFTERAAGLFHGDTVELVSRLIAESDVEPGDLSRLRELLEREEGRRTEDTRQQRREGAGGGAPGEGGPERTEG